jgi:hypothetical protein
VTPSADAAGYPGNISPGDRVLVSGRLYGIAVLEANHVTVVDAAYSSEPADSTPTPAPAPVPVDANPAPAPVALDTDDAVTLIGTVDRVASERDVVIVTGDDTQTYRVRAGRADIILPDTDRAGTLDDLGHGVRVKVIAERISDSVLDANRIRVLGPAEDAPPPPVAVAPVQVEDLSVYTGILIDVRDFRNISRSPSPAIYGPDMSLMYPDRAHVPTPDEVQDESIVRYYRSEDAADAGVGGSHPLILPAEEVVGPAEDSVMLSADNATLFNKLNDRLHFMSNWKVGFLVPADR